VVDRFSTMNTADAFSLVRGKIRSLPILMDALARVRWASNGIKRSSIKLLNSSRTLKYADFGSGRNSEAIDWWTGDSQEGYVIDENCSLPFSSGQLEFAYSSMFFEHINDATALRLMCEVARSLKKGCIFRIVVPNFSEYISRYRSGDADFFRDLTNCPENIETWRIYDVPNDIEHLFVSAISSLHNIPHDIVDFPWQERLELTPPRVCSPHKIEGYYCGPAPEISTEDVRSRIASLGESEFLRWVFAVTAASKYADKTFNSWHKNFWDFEKISRFAHNSGFEKCEQSAFSPKYGRREKPGHKYIGLYFDLTK